MTHIDGENGPTNNFSVAMMRSPFTRSVVTAWAWLARFISARPNGAANILLVFDHVAHIPC
jgi:hypothetical protein